MAASVLVAAASVLVAAGCAPEGWDQAGPAAVTVSGSVTDRVSGAPVAGAAVYLPGTDRQTVSGPAGDFALSGILPGAAPLAVAVSARGFLDLRREGLEADAGGQVVTELRLFPAAPDADAERALRGPRPAQDEDLSGDLRPEARALITAARARPVAPTLREVAELLPPPPSTPGVLRQALAAPPATIRVWRRRLDGSSASCSGRVDEIPFEKYVKGVLCHEWIPSWDTRSLEMGAVAIRTYAWWWVVSGGKYDCADLDDTTASQVYEDEFLPRTDAAVDATAGAAVIRDGSLVFAEYSAENGDPTAFGASEPYCAGHEIAGHRRGTCQWGTQRWATNEGKDYVWMSAHYYPGASVELPGPAYAASFVAESYPAAMTAGDEAVVWLEYRNDGTATWDVDGTRVGTTEPRDRASAFYVDGNWLAPNRATGADHSDYGRGVVGRFTFTLRAPEVAEATTFVEHFGLVQEGASWFGPPDDAVAWTITVSPRASSAPDAGVGGDAAPVGPGGPVDPADPGPATLLGGCRVGTWASAPGPGATGAGLVLCAILLCGARRRRRR